MKNKKKFMIGAYSIGLTAIVVALVIALNLFVGQLPTTLTKPDTSPEKLATVGEDSKKILKSVDTDITIYRIYSESYTYTDSSNSQRTIPLDTNLKNLLDKYKDASSHIDVKEVDPVTDPKFLAEYTDSTLNQNSLVVVSEKRSICIDSTAMYKYEIDGYAGQYFTYDEYYQMLMYDMYYGSGSGYSATEYFFGENEITRAIDYVTSDNIPVIYELSGHGESSITATSYGSIIAEENAELKTLELLSGESVSIPEDASAIIISAPSADLTEAEKDALISYIDNGGDVILLSYVVYHSAEQMPNLAALCAHMGLEAIEEIICENDENHYYPYSYYLIPDVSGNGITQNIATNLYIYMPESHAIKETGEGENISAVSLLNTSSEAFIYTEESATDPDGAEKQTFSIAYQSTVTDSEGNASGGTLYWFATPNLLANEYAGYGNGELFTALLAETCDKPASVSIIGKPITQSTIQLTEQISTVWSAIILVAIPAVALAAGFGVWFKRRRR